MDREFSDSKFDYHKFLYEQLTAQISSIQAIVKTYQIANFETMLENELVRDALLLKFILLQRTINRVGTGIMKERYKIKLQLFPWIESEYFDRNGIVHYDCVWLMVQDLKRLKRQIERIKKYDESLHSDFGEDVRCSFCGKSYQETERIIASSHEAICSDCVKLCMEILEEVGTDK